MSQKFNTSELALLKALSWYRKDFVYLFFLGRVSLWTTADPYSNPYAFTLLLFAGASHHRSYCRCATHRSTFKLSAALPSRKAHFVLPEGRTHFFATRYVRWRHFPPLMPILYSRTSEETTLRPLFGRGFISGFSFPPLICHSVCEMAPLSPSDANFVFSDIRGDHSAPVIWAGFHRRVFLPSTFLPLGM